MSTHPNEPSHPCNECNSDHLGLTKREHFAAMAMQGLMQHFNPHCTIPDLIDSKRTSFAKYAVAQADALIKALDTSPTK